MLDREQLEGAVSRAGIPAPPSFRRECDSTNRVALELAEAGADEWTVVAAAQQTAGRGRLGRSWASAPGKSLMFSIVLRPMLEPTQAPLLSLLAAWAAVESSPPLAAGFVRAKWPNDLVVGGRKLGGILPEAMVVGGRLQHLVLGIGVNVSMRDEDFPPDIRGSATSLAIEGASVEQADLLARFLVALRASYAPADPGAGERIIERYRAVCDTLGRRVLAVTTERSTIVGTARGVSSSGGLVIEGEGGRTQVIAFGEVAHLD